jgi:hypothetical protein
MSRIGDEFTSDLAATICERIMQGMSLRQVCAMDDMPARSTVHKWLAANADFADQYARACAVRADEIFDEIFDIADDASNDWMERKDDDGALIGWRENGESVRRSAIRIDARKWALARMEPKKYGDKLAMEHSGSMVITHEDALNDLASD